MTICSICSLNNQENPKKKDVISQLFLILSGAGVSNLVDLARGAFTISCYFIAIFGFDTADNEPPKDFMNGVSTLAPLGVDRPNKYRSGIPISPTRPLDRTARARASLATRHWARAGPSQPPCFRASTTATRASRSWSRTTST